MAVSTLPPPPDAHTPVDVDEPHGVFYSWHEWFTRLWRAVTALQTASASTAEAAQWVPYYIPAGETFTVPLNKQALFAVPITGPGAIVVNGILVQVS